MRRSTHRLLAGLGLVLAATAALFRAPTPAPAEPPAAGHKAYVESVPGSSVSFDMLPIPGGTFLMGSPTSEKGRSDDEGPQHPVAIRPFWMAKTETTWDLYDLYWKSTDEVKDDRAGARQRGWADAITRPTPPYADETFGHGREGNPVLCITHHAAMEFCRWLSIKTGKIYRLPTEAEWEYAARAGTSTPYFFGDDPSKLVEYAWFAGNSEDLAHKVGKKKPNPWGLQDVYGNVAEWCLDHYDRNFYGKFDVLKPALGPVNLPTELRFPHVARGGSWADQPAQCRSAARRGSDKSWIKLDPQRPQSIWWLTSADFAGFRIVRALEEQDNLKGLKSKVTRQSK
jgi:formylglycine-generating enzyme required for sulfatase activity